MSPAVNLDVGIALQALQVRLEGKVGGVLLVALPLSGFRRRGALIVLVDAERSYQAPEYENDRERGGEGATVVHGVQSSLFFAFFGHANTSEKNSLEVGPCN